MSRIFTALVWFAVAVGLVRIGPVAAQEDAARADALKAAFVYNFAKFAEWPPGRFQSDAAPLVICVGSGSHLGEAFSLLSGKPVGAHRVEIAVLPPDASPAPCHVLFIDAALSRRQRQLAESGTIRGLLTVSDLPDFARTGGQIGLYYANNQLRFQINLGTARRNGISFSSQLLRLADVIGQESGLRHVRIAALDAGLLTFPAWE